MRFTQFTENQVEAMLATIGTDSVDALFSTIPPEVRREDPLNIPTGLSELELLRDEIEHLLI